jgi:hypothetical protein
MLPDVNSGSSDTGWLDDRGRNILEVPGTGVLLLNQTKLQGQDLVDRSQNESENRIRSCGTAPRRQQIHGHDFRHRWKAGVGRRDSCKIEIWPDCGRCWSRLQVVRLLLLLATPSRPPALTQSLSFMAPS